MQSGGGGGRQYAKVLLPFTMRVQPRAGHMGEDSADTHRLGDLKLNNVFNLFCPWFLELRFLCVPLAILELTL